MPSKNGDVAAAFRGRLRRTASSRAGEILSLTLSSGEGFRSPREHAAARTFLNLKA